MNRQGLDILAKAVDALQANQLVEARRLINDALACDPELLNGAEYLFIAAMLNLRSGHLEAGKEQLRQLHLREPRNPKIARQLGQFLLQIGDLRQGGYYLLRARRVEKAEGREDVFVFGDSHSEYCFSGIPRCRVNWLGPMTMHRVGRDGLGALDFRASGVPEKATVVLVFGEIDIRTHVLRQCDDHGRDLDEVLQTLAANFIRTALANRATYQDLQLVLCSVTPPTTGADDPALPFYGAIETRITATKQLNALLQAQAQAHGMKYLDLYKYFFEYGSGALNRFYADNSVHIRKEFHDLVEYELSVTADLP